MRFYLLLSSFFVLFQFYGQLKPTSFNYPIYYGNEEGLTTRNIRDIREDSSGFLWLATNEGVIRYDGYRFTKFNSFQNDTDTGKLNTIYSITIDSTNNTIWVGGKNGLFYSSLDDINFRLYPLWDKNIKINYPAIRALIIDSKNIMWIGGLNGIKSLNLNKLEYKNGKIKENINERSLNIPGVNKLIKDNENPDILWATGVGVYEININTLEFVRYLYDNNTQNHENSIRSINQTTDRLLLGTYSAGAIVFEKKDKTFSRLTEDVLNVKDDIYNIVKNSSGYWFTTPKGIVNLDSTLSITKEIKNNNFETNKIYGLSFIDSRGIPWYGFVRGLISYNVDQANSNFISLESYSQLDRNLIITSIEPFKDNYYISGYSSNGIYKVNPETGTFLKITIDNINPDVDGFYHISAAVRVNTDSILMAVNNRLMFFNLATEQFSVSPLQLPSKDKSIKTIVMQDDSLFWVGDRRNGLFRVDFNKQTVENFNEKLFIEDGSIPWINNLFIDSNDHLWIARGSKSLLSLNDMESKSISPTENIPFYQDVFGFLEDKEGKVWLAGGTDGLGYIRSNTVREGVSHVLDGKYDGIYRRNDSTVWLQSENLKIFNLNTMSIESVISNSEFGTNRITGPVVQDNELAIIGCANGIILYPLPSDKSVPPEIYIQQININGDIFYKGQSLSKRIFDLPKDTRNLSAQVGFFGIGNQQAMPAQYQYRTNEQWIDLDPLGNINITNLDHGLYTLDLRPIDYSKKSGIIQFQFQIKPYWYNSDIAYLVYLILFGLSIYGLYKFNLTRKLAIAESRNSKELASYKSKMYANITHEFRTPLTVILGLADTVKADIQVGNNKHAKEATSIIERNGKALLQLVNQLLGISKLESGTIEVKLVQADIVQFLRYINKSFKSYAEKSKIELVFDSEINSLYMDFDDEKLQTIVSNLLSNAIKFTPANGKVKMHIEIIEEHKNQTLRINVIDNGFGIHRKSLPFIFDRFYQVDHVQARSGSGTGIGLAMSKELTELMNGTLDVESVLNKGTTMSLNLPISNNSELLSISYLDKVEGNDSQNEIPNWSSSLYGDNQLLPQVLVIEDNADVIYYLKICLHSHYKIIIARNGDEGISKAVKEIPDLIVSDVMMPNMDGYEVCQFLKNDPRTDHIPIILLTSKTSEKDRLKGLSCGADAYLNKPFIKAELLTRLDQLLLLRKRLVQSLTQSKYSQILKSENDNPETKFLQKIINLIHNEIDNPELGSLLLAQNLNMSESQIYRKIKAITNKSTAIFIRSVRLEKAKDLVKTSDNSISEIAYKVGFNDPSWFTRAFKKEFGQSPKSYQKGVKN